jgi:hypothetical protein
MQAIKVLQAILKMVLVHHDHHTYYSGPLHTEKKNDKDNCLLPLCRQDTKTGKDSKKVHAPHKLVFVLCLLIIVGILLLLIIVIVIVIGSTSETDAKSSQLSRSQRGIGIVS